MEDVVYTTRLYRLYGTHGIKVEPVELSPGSLDPNYVFVCDAGLKIYVWAGSKVCWSVFLECFFFVFTVYPCLRNRITLRFDILHSFMVHKPLLF